MKRSALFLLLLIDLLSLGFALPVNIIVNNPQPGQSVQGVVEITGSVVSDFYSSTDVYYAYENNQNETWFLITHLNQKVENGVIARWDTTTISDGEYQIKVRMIKLDNSAEELIVKPVYVRNYSPLPTTTPVSTSSSFSTLKNTPTSYTETYATPFPPNPAAASAENIRGSMLLGIIVVALTFAGLMGYRYLFNHNHLH